MSVNVGVFMVCVGLPLTYLNVKLEVLSSGGGGTFQNWADYSFVAV